MSPCSPPHAAALLLACLLLAPSPGLTADDTPAAPGPAPSQDIDRAAVLKAQVLIGLGFSDQEVDGILGGLKSQRARFEALRKVPLENSVPPALVFNPIPVGFVPETNTAPCRWSP